MRKISKQSVEAFLNNEPFNGDNTKVVSNNGSTSLVLHGNIIAVNTANGIEITNSGWFTNVTKERLNAIPNVSISQSKGEWFLNGKIWDGSWIAI